MNYYCTGCNRLSNQGQEGRQCSRCPGIIAGRERRSRSQLSEKQIQKQITDLLDALGFVYSVTDASGNKGKSKMRKGWPDVTFLYSYKGQACAGFIECKSADGKLRPEQAELIARFEKMGALVLVAKSVDDVASPLMVLKKAIGK